jgi:hypothetical protein
LINRIKKGDTARVAWNVNKEDYPHTAKFAGEQGILLEAGAGNSEFGFLKVAFDSGEVACIALSYLFVVGPDQDWYRFHENPVFNFALKYIHKIHAAYLVRRGR